MCVSEHTGTAVYRIQQALQNVQAWADDWGININRIKTQATLFPLSTAKEQVNLKLGNEQLLQTDTPTFLGVKLDQRLTWKPHIQETENRAIRKLGLMKKLSGISWGANSKILKQVYTGAVRPTMEYALTALGTASKTNKSRLDKVQNMDLTKNGTWSNEDTSQGNGENSRCAAT